MKKIILRNGLRSLIVMTAIFVVNFLVMKSVGYEVQEIMGYAGIILSLLFVYFGMRQYRDRVNGGVMRFGQGLKVGVLITLLPSVLFGLIDQVYSHFIDKDFYKNYYAAYQQKLKLQVPAERYAAALQQLESERAMFSNPLIQFGVMFLTVFLIGVIITVISALILRRKARVSPQAA